MQGDAELLASIFGGDPADNGPDPESEVQEPEVEISGAGDNEEDPANELDPEDIEGSQETEGPGPTDDQQEEPAPRLYAGKYKTVEDMEKAYLESQKDFHADRQDKAAMRRELDELRMMLTTRPPEQPKQPTREEIEAKREELRRRLQYEPEAVIEEMAAARAAEAEQRALQKFEAQISNLLGPVLPSIQRQAQSDQLNQQVQQYWRDHPDREEYKDAMSEVITNNPEIIRSPDWIDQAYLRAKIASLESKINTTTTKPAKKVDPGKKKAAAVTVSSGAKSGPSDAKTEDELLRDHIFGTSTSGKLVFDD